MNRAKWNYLIDVFLFVLMASVVFIGILLGFVTAEGPVADHTQKYFLGLHRHQWGDIHLWLSIALVVLVVIHVVLHWNWIKGCTKKFLRTTGSLLCILSLPVLVILAVWGLSEKDAVEYQRFGVRAGPLHQPVDVITTAQDHVESRPEAAQPDIEGDAPRKVEVNGRMSLAEVERHTGVRARAIADAIGLPAGTPLGTNLGRLRREYGFAIEQVREAVNRLSGGTVLAVDSDATTAGSDSRNPPASGGDVPAAATTGQGAGRGLGQGGGRGLGQGGGRGLGQGGGRGVGGGRGLSQGGGRGLGQGGGRGLGQGAAAGSQGAGQGLGRSAGGGAGLHQQPVNGRLSFVEIEKMTGVSARALANRLGLPAGVSLNERIGPLRRQYGFSLQDVRAAISALKND